MLKAAPLVSHDKTCLTVMISIFFLNLYFILGTHVHRGQCPWHVLLDIIGGTSSPRGQPAPSDILRMSGAADCPEGLWKSISPG